MFIFELKLCFLLSPVEFPLLKCVLLEGYAAEASSRRTSCV
jgi:hypothetical protein